MMNAILFALVVLSFFILIIGGMLLIDGMHPLENWPAYIIATAIWGGMSAFLWRYART